MALTVVAAYDVREDDRRAKLAALLQSVGDRVQKSVFLLVLDASELVTLRERALQVIDPDVDSLYFLHQCASCYGTMDCVGQASTPSRTLYWAVL